MDYKSLCQEVTKLARNAGNYIHSQRGKLSTTEIRAKGRHDFVTRVDLASEKMLVEGLTALLPGSGILAEERGQTSEMEYNWIIDPLDGTSNFIHGLPPFSVSIALENKGQLVIGVVYEIVSGECFYTWKDAPAYLDGKEIRVSEVSQLEGALVGTGFPYSDFERLDAYFKTLNYCMKHTHGIRRPGSAAVDLAYLACGRFDAFWEYGLNAWDVAAGSLLIRNAGGMVSDFSGQNHFLFNREIIAANSSLYEEFFEIVAGFFSSPK